MSTVTVEIQAGDVIEVEVGGEAASALVLLVSDGAVILDACDGSTPFVVRSDELGSVRVFDGATA
jgi:hypothetical protein